MHRATKFGVVRLGQKRGISTQFGVCYFETDLHNYRAESNETFYNVRIYIEVVHLVLGFVVRPKLGSYVVKNEEFQHNETNTQVLN